ncbi:signal-regulatory protein beta-2-like [Thunnus albacares]|uniref:signal-regulatory protein beta-2-like n=1 Tax=Thunnus albacares TaxID=8236 RepID=UPI001CF69B01|nr:signal-regulatory protein beta-2-like [Thunnus albacares]
MMMYSVNVFLLCSLCVVQLSEISQPVSFQTVKLGDSATIECHIKSEMKKRVWYKLTTGKRLQLVTAFDSHYYRNVFADEFRHHYSVKFNSISSNLSISATKWEDVGTYYCGVMNLNDVQFGPGTFLMLKGAKMISDSVVQQAESQSVQPGHSVTLSCSVHTDRCAAEHTRVLWLKNSDYSAPEMIYSSGNKNDTCQSTETGSGEATCVYNLLMRNLSSDDAGIYYCAVTSCGEVLFGNGTRININRDTAITKPAELSPTVIVLLLSNVSLGIVTFILIWALCRSRRKDPTEANDGSSEGNQISQAVIYASVSAAPRRLSSRRATVKYSGDSVVYSDIRY